MFGVLTSRRAGLAAIYIYISAYGDYCPPMMMTARKMVNFAHQQVASLMELRVQWQNEARPMSNVAGRIFVAPVIDERQRDAATR
jgi:hypothetical protein